jgi:hypothetical protein
MHLHTRYYIYDYLSTLIWQGHSQGARAPLPLWSPRQILAMNEEGEDEKEERGHQGRKKRKF